MKPSEWIDEYGLDAVEGLTRKLGGRRVYMPISGPAPAALREALGDEWAEELRASHAGGQLEIPRWRTVSAAWVRLINTGLARSLIEDGFSNRRVALATGLSRPAVVKIRKLLAS